jgi:hypothetical protein
LAITHQPGPMDHADSRSHSGVPHQAPKLPRSLAERRITQRVLEHESVMMPPCACPLPSIISAKNYFKGLRSDCLTTVAKVGSNRLFRSEHAGCIFRFGNHGTPDGVESGEGRA